MIPVSDIYDYSSEGVENVIVYASGTIDKPIITKVLRIDIYEESKTLDRIRRDIYAFGRRGVFPAVGEFVEFYYRTKGKPYGIYKRDRNQNDRLDSGRQSDRGAVSGRTAEVERTGGATENKITNNDAQSMTQKRISTPDPSTILKDVIRNKVGAKEYGKYTESLKKYQDLDVRVRNQEKRIAEIDKEIKALKHNKAQSGKGARRAVPFVVDLK